MTCHLSKIKNVWLKKMQDVKYSQEGKDYLQIFLSFEDL